MFFDDVKVIESADNSVKKLVFTSGDAIAEAVLYKYPDYKTRTVICCSTMSGCPVGCRFCGAGDYFVRNLNHREIIDQVQRALDETGMKAHDMDRLQIMFMSMGEPLLNRQGMVLALSTLYALYSRAALLISTIGPRINYDWVYSTSEAIPTIGLQFSIHEPLDIERDRLIPFKEKLSLDEIAAVGAEWHRRTGRRPFFNYCAAPHNTGWTHAALLAARFDPAIWECTVSVICERNEGLPARNDLQQELAQSFSQKMMAYGYNVRVFDPAGQDDIGGGCGQLWFVQQWMKDNPDKARASIGHGLPEVHTPAAS